MDSALGHLVFSVKYEVIGDQEHLRLMLRYASSLLISHPYIFILNLPNVLLSEGLVFDRYSPPELLCFALSFGLKIILDVAVSILWTMSHIRRQYVSEYPIQSHLSLLRLHGQHLHSTIVSKLDTRWTIWASVWVERDNCRTLLTSHQCDIITVQHPIWNQINWTNDESVHPSVKM